MTYGKFIVYNVVGGIPWVAMCLCAGYFFGNLTFVKQNFSVGILAHHLHLHPARGVRVRPAQDEERTSSS